MYFQFLSFKFPFFFFLFSCQDFFEWVWPPLSKIMLRAWPPLPNVELVLLCINYDICRLQSVIETPTNNLYSSLKSKIIYIESINDKPRQTLTMSFDRVYRLPWRGNLLCLPPWERFHFLCAEQDSVSPWRGEKFRSIVTSG